MDPSTSQLKGSNPSLITTIPSSSKKRTSTELLSSSKLSNYTLLKLIGVGGFGEVILCRSKSDKSPCAMKVMSKKRVTKSDSLISSINQEVEILKRLAFKSPYLVNIRQAFSNSHYLFIVLEFIQGGDLYTLIITQHVSPRLFFFFFSCFYFFFPHHFSWMMSFSP